jgi:hypothetical protein
MTFPREISLLDHIPNSYQREFLLLSMDTPIELPLQSQHYVPKGYLKQFTFDGSQFYQRYNEGPNTFTRTSMTSVCCENNFYDLHGTNLSEEYGIPVRYLEGEFHSYECKLPGIIKKIKEKTSHLSMIEFGVLVDAYVSIKHRNPFARERLSEMMGDIGSVSKSIDNVIAQDPTVPFVASLLGLDFNEFKQKAIEHAINDKDAARRTQLDGLVRSKMRRHDVIEDAIFKLSSMRMVVLEVPDGHYLLTSDNPGFTVNDYVTHNTNFGEFDFIIFPLSSKQALKLHDPNPLNLLQRERPIGYRTMGLWMCRT